MSISIQGKSPYSRRAIPTQSQCKTGRKNNPKANKQQQQQKISAHSPSNPTAISSRNAKIFGVKKIKNAGVAPKKAGRLCLLSPV
jgi:hypothetical protein